MPESKVLLLSIFPRGATPDDKHRQLNAEINAVLPSLADGHTVYHLDINNRFLDEEGGLSKAIMPDLLHPSADGYQIWMDAVKPTVDKLLEEGSGYPTPLEIWADYDPEAGDFKEEIVTNLAVSVEIAQDGYVLTNEAVIVEVAIDADFRWLDSYILGGESEGLV